MQNAVKQVMFQQKTPGLSKKVTIHSKGRNTLDQIDEEHTKKDSRRGSFMEHKKVQAKIGAGDLKLKANFSQSLRKKLGGNLSLIRQKT
jgi:hypothetical protein